MTIYTMLADGFEEVEALAVIDVLKRADYEVKTVSIQDKEVVTGAHNIENRSGSYLAQGGF